MTQSLKLAVVCSLMFIVLALVGPSAQSKSDSASLPFSSVNYLPGERLTYNVSFANIISAAHVELQVGDRGEFFGREGLQLRAHVETTGVVNAALFAINNDYISYVDPETGLPFQAQQVVREGTRTSNTSRAFNDPAAIPSKLRNGESPGIYDLLSAIYRVRALPLAEGSTYYLNVKGETEDYQAEVKVTGRQTIKTTVGSFNTVVSQVRVNNNSQANSYHIRIFFSDDDRHIPVLITARIGAGEIRAELAGSDVVKTSAPVAVPTTPVTPVVGPTPVATPRPPADSGDSNLDLPFKVGEQLNYQIFLGDMKPPAGTATFQVRARSRQFDRDAFQFTLRAQTTNAAQRLFMANEQISSYVDPKALLPFRSEMSLAEGSRRLNQILTINQDYGAATSDKGEKIEIPIGTHDYLSFFYLARTFNITPPRRNAVSILVNNRPKTLYITSLKRETIQIGSQSIPAIQLSLTTDDPQPDKYVFRVWISDDKRRLPLRLTASTQIGQVRADLAIIPLTSQ
ncbi:MAG: DUF3108 domain-containing protein [Pyrinomonadaceae bacterium]|nr:DUF3108 domain-containing protein [Pyrinomonadaceae bacterium]